MCRKYYKKYIFYYSNRPEQKVTEKKCYFVYMILFFKWVHNQMWVRAYASFIYTEKITNFVEMSLKILKMDNLAKISKCQNFGKLI